MAAERPARRALRADPVAEVGRQWGARWAGAAEAEAAISVVRAYRIVIGTAERVLAPYDLTFARYETLLILHFSQRGSLPLGKISQRLQVHATSVTNAVDRLVSQGFVARVSAEGDRRTVLAEITDAGRVTVEAATAALLSSAFALGGLGPEDLAALTTIIRKLRQGVGDFEGEPS